MTEVSELFYLKTLTSDGENLTFLSEKVGFKPEDAFESRLCFFFPLENRNFADIRKRINNKFRVWVKWYEIERQKFGGLIELGLAMLISDFYLDQYWIKCLQINF